METIKQVEAKETGVVSTVSSLRINVGLLDTLMNLAGELVLSRNQLLQGLGSGNVKATALSGQRIDMITSELQEAIMRTRMQPIGNILNKFTREVRELAQTLGKTIDLTLEGTEVELDKTILEAISDPLTHLVRDSAAHGIETPEERKAKGKKAVGQITIKAFHEAGQVNILISDDGRGKDPDKITNVSGRGMDVVTTNIETLGGVIELDSKPGKGTDIQIKLPLTLAIIPSQITEVGEDRYAIPQVNLSELLRIPAAEVKDRIERVGEAEVVRLRGELLPLLDLSKILGEQTDQPGVDASSGTEQRVRTASDRRQTRRSVVNIAVVSAGAFKYGLVVDALQDSEEIVVKPVGRHLNQITAFAGATIMGDGKVALILDIAGLGLVADLSGISETVQTARDRKKKNGAESNKVSFLTFKNTDTEHFAVPMSLVERIERFRVSQIETIGTKKVVQYRGGALPLFEISQVCGFDPLPDREFQEVIVFRVKDRDLGLMVSPPVDTIEAVPGVEDTNLKQKGISGSMTIKNHTALLVDIFEMLKLISV